MLVRFELKIQARNKILALETPREFDVRNDRRFMPPKLYVGVFEFSHLAPFFAKAAIVVLWHFRLSA
jgi:hypothetical protein